MGRHSRPDSEDSASEPSDQDDADPSGARVRRYERLPRSGHEPEESPNARPIRHRRGSSAPAADGQYPADDDYAGSAHRRRPRLRLAAGRCRPVPGDGPLLPRTAGNSAARPTQFRAGHREAGEWQGGHRSKGGRRGVSIGVIVALVAVVVVVAGVIVWQFFGDALVSPLAHGRRALRGRQGLGRRRRGPVDRRSGRRIRRKLQRHRRARR